MWLGMQTQYIDLCRRDEGGEDLPQLWHKEDEGEDVIETTVLGGGQESSSNARTTKTIYQARGAMRNQVGRRDERNYEGDH